MSGRNPLPEGRRFRPFLFLFSVAGLCGHLLLWVHPLEFPEQRKAALMEIWDLVDLKREVIGQHIRGTEMPPDAYHQVVHVWIRSAEGKYLLTQRSPMKKTCPLKWECVGGSVLQGETSLHAALREVQEEVGIALQPVDGRLVLTQVRDYADGVRVNDINDVYLFGYSGGIPLADASTDEVIRACWAAREEIEQLWYSGEMVSGIKDLSYFIDNPDGVFD